MATTSQRTPDRTQSSEARLIERCEQRARDMRSLALAVLVVALLPVAWVGTALRSADHHDLQRMVGIALCSALAAGVVVAVLHGLAALIELHARQLHHLALRTERENVDRL